MKTYGAIHIAAGGQIAITAEPHVMIRLKALVPRINKSQFGTVTVARSPAFLRDLEWFLDRYPMEMTPEAAVAIALEAREHRRMDERLEAILQTDYKPGAYDLAVPLRDYQARAVDTHLAHGSLLLGDQVGLGKTPTAIGSFTDPRTLPALVVCQPHLCRQWQSFIARFLPLAQTHIIKQSSVYALASAEVYIISYSKLSGWGESLGAICSIVFDEVQELRRAGTQKYCAAEAVRSGCRFALGLSATPIYNYGGEIFNVVDLLSPGRLGTREEFYREWCTFRGKENWMIKEPATFGAYLRDEHLMLRRTRADVGLELPAVEKVVQTVPYDPQVIDAIQDTAAELARLVLHGTFMESGQAARELDLKLRQATGIAKAPFVAEFVRLLVEDGQQVLLFGWHREVYDIWLSRLADLQPVMYTGSESPKQKRAAQEAFESGLAKVMFMSLRSGSGVDGLQRAANTVVFGELDWSPGVHEQCTGRLNRDGVVESGVTAFYLVSDAGSDPLVAEILQLKGTQSCQMLDPSQPLDFGEMQTANDRIKRLAQQYLQARKISRA